MEHGWNTDETRITREARRAAALFFSSVFNPCSIRGSLRFPAFSGALHMRQENETVGLAPLDPPYISHTLRCNLSSDYPGKQAGPMGSNDL
jgi:hypothetical protein